MKRYFAFVMLAFMLTGQAAGSTNWKGVDEALGRAGTVQAGDVHRYGFPRSDLKVSLDGVPLEVAFAGLTPGGVGVYQINVKAPHGVRGGQAVPLVIRQGGMSTTVAVQVAAE